MVSCKRLAVFDFDWSLIDVNSDIWIFDDLSKESRLKLTELHKQVQWTDLMDLLLGELHEKGINKEQILESLAKVPFSPSMIETLQVMKNGDADIIIISDANLIFIETILKAHGVHHLISAIITNPAAWDENGRLRVQRLIKHTDEPHHCLNKCAVNICKGRELETYLASSPVKYDKIIYVGDSVNDFCPATKMSSNDTVLIRKGFRLEEYLNDRLSATTKIKSKIIYWNDAEHVLQITKNEFANEESQV
ncbi:9571_t:CDS:2 [Paraglomus occultum]|uniref:9571_t:CDS:1 n=1 Tax=Paraglomus occultum TaxID=144539 RepID=A0A9N9CRL3_9GLOM|nr:9571_t:CDS:2 [Paraglomus occultum]